MKKRLCLILSFLLTLAAFAVPQTVLSATNVQSAEKPYFRYKLNGEQTVSVFYVDDSTCPSGEVLVIPETLDGYTVTEVYLGGSGERDKRLVLPKTVRALAGFSLYGADITELYLPEGLETISYHVFHGGDSIVIPSTVTFIDQRAFGWGGTPTTLTGQTRAPGTIVRTPGFTVYSDGNEVARAYAASDGHAYVDLSEYERGDTDLNGGTDMMDAVTVLSVASGAAYGSAVQRVMADATRDGTINMMDALAVYRTAAGAEA